MVAVSGGLIFIGYQLLVYGVSQVRGENAGFFDILWPGRYKGNTPDSSTGNTYNAAKGGLNNTGAGGTIGGAPQNPAGAAQKIFGNNTGAFPNPFS